MNLRLFIGLIVVLGVLFVVGVGVGIGADGAAQPSLDDADWAQRIERLIPSSALTTDAVDSASPLTCLDSQRDELVVAANGQCRLELANARGQRKLQLRLIAGDSAEITLVQPVNKKGGMLTSEEAVSGGDSAEIDIFRRQTEQDEITVAIRCRALDNEQCRLQFP